MHYRNDREAKNDDPIVKLDGGVVTHVGKLQGAVAGNDYCNGDIVNDKGEKLTYACLCDCLHVDDLVAILKEKGLDKRPPGK